VDSQTQRTIIRASLIALQWLFLTVAVGSLVMRSDPSFSDVINPHLGAAPMFAGSFAAAFLLGLTLERPRYLVPLVISMCLGAAAFIGVLSYAPVVDGTLVRTTGLDNYVTQRVLIVTLLLAMAAVPGAAGGNLLGGYLNVRQEVLPNPEDLQAAEETPWWERRRGPSEERHHIS
jgi:hypothetical protein